MDTSPWFTNLDLLILEYIERLKRYALLIFVEHINRSLRFHWKWFHLQTWFFQISRNDTNHFFSQILNRSQLAYWTTIDLFHLILLWSSNLPISIIECCSFSFLFHYSLHSFSYFNIVKFISLNFFCFCVDRRSYCNISLPKRLLKWTKTCSCFQRAHTNILDFSCLKHLPFWVGCLFSTVLPIPLHSHLNISLFDFDSVGCTDNSIIQIDFSSRSYFWASSL